MLKQALVRRPSPRIAEGEVTHIDRIPMDVERAFVQYEQYLVILQAHGYELVQVAEAPQHPDGLFVEDAVFIVPNGLAIITRPGALSRRGEIETVALTLADLDIRSVAITDPGTLDGGDVLVTDRHVFIGDTSRSNAAAVEQVDTHVKPFGRAAIGVPVTGCLHLKSAITSLPDGSLLGVPGWVDLEWFRNLGYIVHEAADESGGDVLCLGQTVVLPASAEATGQQVRALGFPVELIDVSELQKIEAGVTCMSVLL